MKRILSVLMLVVVCGAVWGQTLETGKVIEYKLPAEDNNTGTFYLGRFTIGKYEISANFGGIHANNTGWKVIIGSNWAWNGVAFREVFSNIKGDFIYQKYDNASFDLWWDAKYGSSGYNWTPHIKVEYQIGNCVYNNPEPQRLSAKIIENNTITSPCVEVSDKINLGKTNVNDKYGVGAKLNFGGTVSNTDPTQIYRYAVSHDVTQLRVHIGDGLSDSDKFIVGTSGNYAGEWTSGMVVTAAGRVGIKKDNPSCELDVDGVIHAEEIKVQEIASANMMIDGTLTANNITYIANGNTADFVFEDNYQLRELSDVESFIKNNRHLPDVPSAAEMEESGVNLAEMNKLLLQKVEELTLYMIEQEKRIKKLEQSND